MTKKQYSTPKVSVGTVKKSIAAMASRWLFRKASHRFAGSGLFGALLIQRMTVRSEMSKPSIFNSPWMRGAPPGRVLVDHAEDEFAQLFGDAFSSQTVAMLRKPRPVQLESRLMPTNNGLRLDEDQRLLPFRPKPPQDNPKQFVRGCKSRLGMSPFQDGELLPKSQIL
jgi:hypothetical protein